jgi:hypothetical protein
MSTTRERFEMKFARNLETAVGVRVISDCGLAVYEIVEFIESEVRLAMAPRDPSPELAKAERALRSGPGNLFPQDCAVIAAELDRLRAITEHCRECGDKFGAKCIEMADTGLCVTCEGKRDERGDASELATTKEPTT